jgi:hypothetical protein
VGTCLLAVRPSRERFARSRASIIGKGHFLGIPPGDEELMAHISQLYATFVTRNCDNPTIAAAIGLCLDLMGTSLIPLNDPISVTERSYVVPGTTTGGYVPEMVYPFIIAGTHNFVAAP